MSLGSILGSQPAGKLGAQANTSSESKCKCMKNVYDFIPIIKQSDIHLDFNDFGAIIGKLSWFGSVA